MIALLRSHCFYLYPIPSVCLSVRKVTIFWTKKVNGLCMSIREGFSLLIPYHGKYVICAILTGLLDVCLFYLLDADHRDVLENFSVINMKRSCAIFKQACCGLLYCIYIPFPKLYLSDNLRSCSFHLDSLTAVRRWSTSFV